MKIGIVGHGFVGKAVDYGFDCGAEKMLIDPALYGNDVADLQSFKPDVVFICVPTPARANGTINYGIVKSVVANSPRDAVVIIKSTVPPNALAALVAYHPRIVYNPEFLCERSANFDFVNPPMLVLGGAEKDVAFVENLYVDWSSCNPCPVYRTDVYAASLVKYAINTFLATKVLFFNELCQFFDHTETTCGWDKFVHMVGTDPRIGQTHMQVPGPDGKKGFGGACFPGNVRSLLAEDPRGFLSVLKTVESKNQQYRRQYEPDDREAAQGYTIQFHERGHP